MSSMNLRPSKRARTATPQTPLNGNNTANEQSNGAEKEHGALTNGQWIPPSEKPRQPSYMDHGIGRNHGNYVLDTMMPLGALPGQAKSKGSGGARRPANTRSLTNEINPDTTQVTAGKRGTTNSRQRRPSSGVNTRSSSLRPDPPSTEATPAPEIVAPTVAVDSEAATTTPPKLHPLAMSQMADEVVNEPQEDIELFGSRESSPLSDYSDDPQNAISPDSHFYKEWEFSLKQAAARNEDSDTMDALYALKRACERRRDVRRFFEKYNPDTAGPDQEQELRRCVRYARRLLKQMKRVGMERYRTLASNITSTSASPSTNKNIPPSNIISTSASPSNNNHIPQDTNTPIIPSPANRSTRSQSSLPNGELSTTVGNADRSLLDPDLNNVVPDAPFKRTTRSATTKGKFVPDPGAGPKTSTSQDAFNFNAMSASTSSNMNQQLLPEEEQTATSSIEMQAGEIATSTSQVATSTSQSPVTDNQDVNHPVGDPRRGSTSSLSSVDDKVLNAPPSATGKNLKRKSPSIDSIPPMDPEMEERRKRLKLTLVEEPDFFVSEARPAIKPPSNDSLARALFAVEQQTQPTTGARKRGAAEMEGDEPQTPAGGGSAKQRRTAKTKTSPIKKDEQTSVAGIPPPEGRRQASPTNNDESESENNDFCSACGGSGYLLCCDGCDKSFHFTCLDPPLDQDTLLEEPWFCFICQANSSPQARPQREIRDFFEGVYTGRNGEYRDQPPPKTNARNRNGQEEKLDLKPEFDKDGEVITCIHCKQSSGGRFIIQCDHCQQWWHLDCLDPPSANAPHTTGQDNRKVRQWMCPNHVEHDLARLDPIHGKRVQYDGPKPAHRTRKPKHPVFVDVELERGHKNNGVIEVADDSDGELEKEQLADGTVYRLPAKSIQLDFLDRAKRQQDTEMRAEAQEASKLRLERERLALRNERLLKNKIRQRPAAELQTGVGMIQMAHTALDTNLRTENDMDNLIAALVAQAPADADGKAIASELATTEASRPGKDMPPSPPASSDQVDMTSPAPHMEREKLMRLQKLIEQRLAAIAGTPT